MTYLPAFLQLSSRQVWFQAIGRLLYQTGYGLIQFYIPLVFVKQIGLSATAVGLGIGSGSLAGFVGHFLGGYLADSPAFGRKKTLLVAAVLSILAAVVLVLTRNLPLLVVANLIMGLSAGCYWTAADAAVIDVTASEKRHNAFAVMVLADSIGSGLGVSAGGLLLTLIDRIQALFVLSGVLFVVFLILIQTAIVETHQDNVESNTRQGFAIALQDRSLRLFIVVNVLFTTYIALVSSTIPLYLTIISTASLTNIASLYTWCYVGLGAILQLPLVQILGALPRIQVLGASMLLWGVAFFGVWLTEVAGSPLVVAIAALSLLSLATVIYKPFAPAVVAELAPASLRGIYLAISYQCWSIGYFIGPIFGGWAIDQPRHVAHDLWLVVSLSTLTGIVVLYWFNRSKAVNPGTEQTTQTQRI